VRQPFNCFVEGKGTSALLARASAYAEMAERISAGHAVKPDFIKKFDHVEIPHPWCNFGKVRVIPE